MLRCAFVGFQHGHIFGMLQAIRKHPECEIVAMCEEDAVVAAKVAADADLNIQITHTQYESMLAEVECDVIVVGDVYTLRGQRIIRALQTGRHVISDKPICTGLGELDQIESLSRQNNLQVGCQLDIRCMPAYRTVRRLVRSGEIGEVHTFNFTGQHPLNLGTRPSWYFQEGRHGGTITDIAIHGVDACRWITGREMVTVTAARAWNARACQYPFFQDAAQLMLRMDNNGGVLGDVSYLSPDSCAGDAKYYWRMLIHGSEGFVECAMRLSHVLIGTTRDSEVRTLELDDEAPDQYLLDFVAAIDGQAPADGALTSDDVFRATRATITAQNAADELHSFVPISYGK